MIESSQRDKLLLESLGKKVRVYYNDTFNTVSSKTGKLLDFDSFIIKVLEEGKETPILVSRSKCIRIELGGEEIAKTRIA